MIQTVWNRSMTIAAIVVLIGSICILQFGFGEILKKELLCSWLLVFINAYIGAFIADQSLKRGPTAFFVWAMLINGFRVGMFLIILLIIFKVSTMNFRAVASVTVFGYFVFLAGEIASLHTQSLNAYKNEQR